MEAKIYMSEYLPIFAVDIKDRNGSVKTFFYYVSGRQCTEKELEGLFYIEEVFKN